MAPTTGLLGFVNSYGYLAVFILVFLQEIGVPNPVPNELVLLFAGALTVIGGLSFWLTLLTAVIADIAGTTLLFTVFYFFEHYIMEKISRWKGINEKLERIKESILRRGQWGIFIGRMMPYLRGYASAVAGILNIPYRKFLPMVIIPAIIWTGGYVTLGHFLGKKWESVAAFISQYQWVLVVAVAAIIGAWFYWKGRKDANNDVR
jgi:membrane protein DedA with SNARE-associated domain